MASSENIYGCSGKKHYIISKMILNKTVKEVSEFNYSHISVELEIKYIAKYMWRKKRNSMERLEITLI